MNILFDENFPRPLRRFLLDHTVKTVQQMGWDGIENGDLLDIAQTEFDVLLTTDKGIKYQQNFTGRDIAVITLRGIDNRIPTLILLMPQVRVCAKFMMEVQPALPPEQSLPVLNCTKPPAPATSPVPRQDSSASPRP